MDTPRLNTWKYTHDGPGERKRWQTPLAIVLLLGSAISYKLIPLPFFLLVGGLIALFASSKKIQIGPRYLICGPHILYFANIERIERDDVAGRLILASADKLPLIIDREKFPTGARKSDKIKRNRQAKFAKVADRIIMQVQAANPHADIRVQC